MKEEEQGLLVLALIAMGVIGYRIGRARNREDLLRLILISALRNSKEQ